MDSLESTWSKVTLKAKISPAFYANPPGPLVKKVDTSIE